MPQGLIPYLRAVAETDRTIAAFEGDRNVGTAAAISFTMGVPGGRLTPCGGLTAVGVHPARRRRGILSALMRRQLDDARDRGEPFGALYASEGPIYGRFGYGPAAPTVRLAIDRAVSGFRVPAAEVADIDLVDAGAAVEDLAEVYDRAQPRPPA